MSAYAGHADPATTGLAMAVPTGSVTLSETGAGAVEVTVGLWHPAGLQRNVAVAMGAGGDEQREVDRALAKQRVVDHLAALRRWAAALAVLRDRQLKGSATAPCPWLLDAVAVAVPGGHSHRHEFDGAAFIATSLADRRIFEALDLTPPGV